MKSSIDIPGTFQVIPDADGTVTLVSVPFGKVAATVSRDLFDFMVSEGHAVKFHPEVSDVKPVYVRMSKPSVILLKWKKG